MSMSGTPPTKPAEAQVWKVGDDVMTVDEDEFFSGTVVAAFKKLDELSWRYAVEGGYGSAVVMVYRAKQLTETVL
jgi:hypothetical protein